MASGASGTYQQSGPAAPQTARAVLATLGPQVGPLPLPAYFATSFATPNSNLVFQARQPGASTVTIALVVAGANTPLTVTVAANAVTVNVATNAASAAASTAAQVRDAVNTNAAASALLSSALTEGDGSGIVSALGTTSLTGNINTGGGTLSNAPLPSQHPSHNTYR
jgi:hypothetical protein